jgi:hypothetical protein
MYQIYKNNKKCSEIIYVLDKFNIGQSVKISDDMKHLCSFFEKAGVRVYKCDSGSYRQKEPTMTIIFEKKLFYPASFLYGFVNPDDKIY